MAFTPTARRQYAVDEPELNLNPMMDLFGVLIPAILMMSAGVQVAVATILAPSIVPPKSSTEPPQTVTLSITEQGYVVEATRAATGVAERWSIPIVDKPVGCSRYRNTRPPPRGRNLDRAACGPRDRMNERRFWTYDTAALTARMAEIKGGAGAEHGLIVLKTDAAVDYETIVDAMDAVRETRTPEGTLVTLFDQVVLSPTFP